MELHAREEDWLTYIETERLCLRVPSLGDAHALFTAYATDPAVTRYLVWKPHTTVAETREYLSVCIEGWRAGKELTWVMEEKINPGAPIGMIALRCEAKFKANLGYVLAQKFWGRGYMPEVVTKLSELALSEAHLGLYRIEALCDVDNVASLRVMEKAGMKREGLLARYLLHPNVSTTPRDAWICARTL